MTAASGPLSARVRCYLDTVARIADTAKQREITSSEWDELAALVDTAAFERIAGIDARFGWDDHVSQLAQWAPQAVFETTVLDLAEAGNLVFATLVERNTIGGVARVVNALAVYEFNGDGKVLRLQTYRQVDPQ